MLWRKRKVSIWKLTSVKALCKTLKQKRLRGLDPEKQWTLLQLINLMMNREKLEKDERLGPLTLESIKNFTWLEVRASELIPHVCPKRRRSTFPSCDEIVAFLESQSVSEKT
jgi:hypothetical protein